jgi:UrcA family protein
MQRALLLAALALASAAPAFAADPDVPSERVPYTADDFANGASSARFLARLRLAAHHVCDVQDRTLRGQSERLSCERRALDRALAEVDRPELYASNSASRSVRVARAGR